MPVTPCWSRETGDCKDRTAGCAIDCEKWKAYAEEREAVRNKRKETQLWHDVYMEQIERRKKVRRK